MMKGTIFWAVSCFALCTASGQTPAPDAGKSSEAAQLEALEKKIDQQNAKIDALSQEILRLEQQLSHVRPEVRAAVPAKFIRLLASAGNRAAGGNCHRRKLPNRKSNDCRCSESGAVQRAIISWERRNSNRRAMAWE